jgi:hypothetical protein
MAMDQERRRRWLQGLGLALILAAIALEVMAVRALRPAGPVVTERVTEIGLEYQVVQAEQRASVSTLFGFGLVVAVVAVRLMTYLPEEEPTSLALGATDRATAGSQRAA